MSLVWCIRKDRKWLNDCSNPSSQLHAVTLCSCRNNVMQAWITLFQDSCSPRCLRNIVAKLVEIMIILNYIQVRGKCGTPVLLTTRILHLPSLEFCTLRDIRSKLFTWVCRVNGKGFLTCLKCPWISDED